MRAITIESDRTSEDDVYIADGEGPNAAAIHIEVVRAMFDITRADPDAADALGEFIVKLANAMRRQVVLEV